jgi:cysteinyl-tRNA synthetase
MDLSWSSLSAANQTLTRWRKKYQEWKKDSSSPNQTQINSVLEKISQDFANDLDTPRALQVIRKMEKDSGLTDSEKMKIFEMSDQLFGLDLTRSINESELLSELSELQQSLLAQRVRARSKGDFKASDRLRDELLLKTN